MEYVYFVTHENCKSQLNEFVRLFEESCGKCIVRDYYAQGVSGAIRVLKSSVSSFLEVGDTLYFMTKAQYCPKWFLGRTYAFLANPKVIYHSGYETGSINQLIAKCFVRREHMPKIKKVIFNKPATIVLWDDDTKTVVQCQKGKSGKIEKFDKEKGLAMCIAKKCLGNKSNFNNEFKRWIEE